MIFRQWQDVLSGRKTQTRRLVKDGDYTWLNPLVFPPEITEVCGSNRLRWTKGKTYAVQPGRGQKAVGRICITEIRRERLQDIGILDIYAEGIEPAPLVGTEATKMMERYAFANLWNSIHIKSGTRWTDNPEVWALTFELNN